MGMFDRASLASSLHRHFGFDSFRAGQEEAITSLLHKNHTLAILPTGAGKSLIYQFAALQLNGLTLVISPLIALMKDQVDALNRRGIHATFINSAIPLSEQQQRLTLLSQGKYRLVYVAPERLRNGAAEAPICCDNCESNKSMSTNETAGDVTQMNHAERAAFVILDAVQRLKARLVGREKLA